MKQIYTKHSILIALFIAVAVATPLGNLQAKELSIPEIIEIFIRFGIIKPEKAQLARALVSETPATTTLSLILPNTDGYVFEIGKEMLIRWESTGLTKLDVNLVSLNNTIYPIATGIPTSLGKSFSWIIPSYIPQGAYRINLKGEGISRTSESYFSITPSATSDVSSDMISVSVAVNPPGANLIKAGSSVINVPFTAYVRGGSGNYKTTWVFDDPLTQYIEGGTGESRYSSNTERSTNNTFNKAGTWNIQATVKDDRGHEGVGNLTIDIEQGQ